MIYHHINLPFDITMVTAILLVLFMLTDFILYGVKISFSKSEGLTFFSLIIFFIWIIISLSYTESPGYSYKKAFFFTTNLVAFFYPLLIKKFDVKRFLKYLVFIVPIVSAYFFYIYINLAKVKTTNPMFYEIAGLYLTLATISGIISLILFTSKVKIFSVPIYNYIAGSVLLFVIILSGARGPLFFELLVLFLYVLNKLIFKKYTFKINLKNFIVSLAIIVPAVSVAVFYTVNKYYEQIETLVHRSIVRAELLINGLFTNQEMGNSVDTRVELYDFTISKIFSSFSHMISGFGIGSFGIIHSGNDIREYSHNILLEIWFELGLIGLVLFLTYLGFNFFGKIKAGNYISRFVLFFIVLNMLKSSSLIDIRVYFTFFALYLIRYNHKLKRNVI